MFALMPIYLSGLLCCVPTSVHWTSPHTGIPVILQILEGAGLVAAGITPLKWPGALEHLWHVVACLLLKKG